MNPQINKVQELFELQEWLFKTCAFPAPARPKLLVNRLVDYWTLHPSGDALFWCPVAGHIEKLHAGPQFGCQMDESDWKSLHIEQAARQPGNNAKVLFSSAEISLMTIFPGEQNMVLFVLDNTKRYTPYGFPEKPQEDQMPWVNLLGDMYAVDGFCRRCLINPKQDGLDFSLSWDKLQESLPGTTAPIGETWTQFVNQLKDSKKGEQFYGLAGGNI